MQKQEIRWIDFIPLAVFTWVSRLMGITDSLETQYYLGACAALAQLSIIYYKKWPLNYIALGANLFLFHGALGYAVHKNFLSPYIWFEEATLFVWVLLVGLAMTLFTQKGFINNTNDKNIRLNQPIFVVASILLLKLTLKLTLISYALTNIANIDTSYGIMLPFIGLITAKEALKKYFIKNKHYIR